MKHIIPFMDSMNERLPLASLYFVSDKEPGFIRQKRGKGFIYYDDDKKIIDAEILERIKKLTIPPNWRNVWICKNDNGYLQATGFDSKGRKQYLYHKDWSAIQQETKFEKLAEFARILPVIRNITREHLRKKGWPKEKVLGLIVNILDSNFMRIGNLHYRENNDTYGLTTLRRKHLKTDRNAILFSYKGKSNVYRMVRIENRKFARLIKECSELPGYEIFRYMNGEGKSVPVTSKDINEYLENITGYRYTSKTFRTWGATVLAIKKYKEAKEEAERNKKLKLKRAIVKKVASELGNTVAVSESYYIHPKVLAKLSDAEFVPEEIPVEKVPGLDHEELLAMSILNMD